MVITIIAEPRSGSTNLANWFFSKNDFTVLYEPITSPNLKWYQNNKHPQSWSYNTEHLLVKEIYTPKVDFSELIKMSDKVIVLYRENISEQSESWLCAKKTNNWDKQWVFKEELIRDEDITYFKEIKTGIRDDYFDKGFLEITYEELYYNNGFQRVVNYLNIQGVNNIEFPYGQKYRVNIDKPRTII